MATIDLGKIKLKWRGTYAGGTAYTPDDVVYYVDGSVGSSYICVANSTGNAPSSGGTLHASWNYLAKGQAASPTTTQGDLIVRGASEDERLAIGAAGKTLKVNASANGLEYGSGGGVLGMNQYITADQFNVNPSGSDWAALRAAHKVDYTAKSTTSHFLLESFISQGMDSHDTMFTMNWWDSLKGASNGNELFPVGGAYNNRTTGSFAMFPCGAAVSGGWDGYWFSGVYLSALYYPDSGQRSTSARSFYPVIKSNAYDGTMYVNYAQENHTYSLTGVSLIRVTEIEGSIVG